MTLIELHVDSSVLVKRWKQNEIFKSEYGEWQYCFLHIVKLDSAITITITSGAGIWYSVSRNQLPRLNIDCIPGKEDDLSLITFFWVLLLLWKITIKTGGKKREDEHELKLLKHNQIIE